jgi:hypothetical protein
MNPETPTILTAVPANGNGIRIYFSAAAVAWIEDHGPALSGIDDRLRVVFANGMAMDVLNDDSAWGLRSVFGLPAPERAG